jgi:S1-C subfamily serine protease
VGAAAIATSLAVVLTFVDTKGSTTALKTQSPGGSDTITAATTAMTSMTTVIGHDVMRMVAGVRPSLVDLEPLDTGGVAPMTGVVLPGGELVLTAASAVAGTSQLDVVTADGKRLHGQVVGTDERSGVAVISTGGGLSPATFADEVVQRNDLDIVACLCDGSASSSQSSAPAAAAVGMVREVGMRVTLEGGPVLVDAIEAEMPLAPGSWGGVLLDGSGRVVGILDGQMTAGNDTLGVFVPAPLAEGVAMELAKTHRIDHGWLGVVCADQAPGGATVTKTLPGSPAAEAGLEPGDMVVAVGTHAVTSVADLQERLYTVPPGATVQLAVVRGPGDTIVKVKLADSPGT